MKKIYIEPTVKEIIVNLEPMMADSITVNMNDDDYTGGDEGIGAKDEMDFDW